MARICSECGKKPQVANLVSNANNRVKRWVYPNLRIIRYTKVNDPKRKVHRGSVCAKCLKGGKIMKVI